MGGFQLVEGEAQVVLAEGSQRLLALLALRGRPVKRLLVAGTLWPDVTEGRAYASLRSALSRLYGAVRDAVEVNPSDLSLAPNVRVDLRESQALAHRLLDAVDEPLAVTDLSRAAITALSGELLPDWYDDWILLEAEDWRQLRLHALEALAGLLAAAGRYGDAAAAALAAVRADPLRESAHAALIQVHLAEHNRSEALREFRRYQRLLRAELDIEPTPGLRRLVDPSDNPRDR
ncbi:BTAD domain-containing putative transcriptional regulator [Candidatus Nephthysia bennettiae]|uniref:AfsR/SARP family transcriptional regulator n=1 Tax=Candidatus Nephthysia bennettiae TaxID=3127016 RepID=UPI0030C682A7